MLSIINNGSYIEEQKTLELMQQDLIDDIQITLSPHGHSIQIDHLEFKLDYRTQDYQRLLKVRDHGLLKALGKQKGTILDGFGGIGKDGFIMAHAGYTVTTFEKNYILYLLLSQAIDKYIEQTPLNWNHKLGDCQSVFDQEYDIVYLDPMFEVNRTAKAKKGMQIIQSLVKSEPFNSYDKAYLVARKRLIIKAHQSTPICQHLPKPSLQIIGQKNFRFDVYIKA